MMRERRVTPGGAVRYYTPDDPTAVYRLYDQNDQLLYVGVAHDPQARWRSHRKKKWWPQVARKTVEWYPNREEAEREESRTIANECPPLNTAGNPEPRLIVEPQTGVPELASYIEIAAVLQVSRQRARELAEKHPDFPAPIARLAMGPVFTLDSVMEFAKGWERRSGRPSKASA